MNIRGRRAVRVTGKALFVLYILFLVYFLIFSDWYGRTGIGGYRYNLILFKEIRRFWEYRSQVGIAAMFTNLFGNVLIFVPFGFFMPMASRRRNFFSTLFYSFGLSLCVETFQLIFMVGSFDVDDLLLNTAGGTAGYALYAGCCVIRRKYAAEKKAKDNGGRQGERDCPGA